MGSICGQQLCASKNDSSSKNSQIEEEKRKEQEELDKYISDLDFFVLPESNKYSLEDLYNKKIIYLYLGFHPFNSGPSILFHVFFYLRFANPREGVIVEYGQFENKNPRKEKKKNEKQENEKKENIEQGIEIQKGKKQKNNRCHFLGKDGLVVIEKSPDDFENELYALTFKLRKKKKKSFKIDDWAMSFTSEESANLENLTFGNFLRIIVGDSEKDIKKWESESYKIGGHNCISFAINVVKKLGLKKDEEEVKKYTDFLKDIGTVFTFFEKFQLDDLFEELKNNKVVNSQNM